MSEIITLKNGQKRETCRVPKFVLWRRGKAASIFLHRIEEVITGEPDLSSQEQATAMLARMTDEEGQQFEALADDIVSHSFNPPVQVELVEPDDYWNLFNKTFYGQPNTPVETKEGTTDIKTVETFRAESGIQANGENVPNLQGDSLSAHGAA